MAGILSRMAAISMPGVILSQLEMQTMRIHFVGIAHIFNGVGDQFPRWQGVEHSIMAHGNAVINGNGVELRCKTALFFDMDASPAGRSHADEHDRVPSG